jgi:hypothetical protein
MADDENTTAAYVPAVGDKVRVLRYVSLLGGSLREDETEYDGIITRVLPAAAGHYIDLEGRPGRIFTGRQFVGAGTLETEVTLIEPAPPELYRVQVTPDMSVVADGGAVVLEVTDGMAGHVLRRVALSDVETFVDHVRNAREANVIHQEEADSRRREGPDEARRARGRLTKAGAVNWLIGKGYPRGHALRMANKLCRQGGSALGMTYADGWWRVPVTRRECEDGQACANSCGPGQCSQKCQVCQRLAWRAGSGVPCPACPDALRRTPGAERSS